MNRRTPDKDRQVKSIVVTQECWEHLSELSRTTGFTIGRVVAELYSEHVEALTAKASKPLSERVSGA